MPKTLHPRLERRLLTRLAGRGHGNEIVAGDAGHEAFGHIAERAKLHAVVSSGEGRVCGDTILSKGTVQP